jgi:glycosidase
VTAVDDLLRTGGLAALRRRLDLADQATHSSQWFEADPTWYRRAVFYEIHVRAFADGNDDGIGDFVGLTERLDYLQWLGVDCIWLLPMYASPQRDGGYDISDFYSVHPDYGTVDDFAAFVAAAHQRGIRVIADLVMNHTSNDHPWFQESRHDPTSPKRDWYVCPTATTATATHASSSSTPRRRTGRGTPSRAPTTGTGSSRTNPTSTSTTPRSPTR